MLQCPTVRSIYSIAVLLLLTQVLISCANSPTPEQQEAIVYRHKLIQLAPKMDAILVDEFRATEELKRFLGQATAGSSPGDMAKVQVFIDQFNRLCRDRGNLLKEVSSQLKTPLPLFVQRNLVSIMDEQNKQLGVWLILLNGLKQGIREEKSDAGSLNRPPVLSAPEVQAVPPLSEEVRLLRTMVDPSTEMQNRLLSAAEELRVELRLPQDTI
jgi:hypothetical protein